MPFLRMIMNTVWVLLIANFICMVLAQSNYADHANNVEYLGEGLPEQATLDGKVTKLDDLSPVIFLNRTKAALNCASGSMQVELKFNEQFFGIAYADFDRNSACQLQGNGGFSYKLELPLKGCGTKQDPQRVFTNNIVVRFHPALEIDGDEIITIVCRYPPPVAPIPAAPPSFIREVLAPATIMEPPLKGFQILMIICGILFLTLLLLGLGGSYYCLRRRNVTVVRKQQFSSIGTESEITKLSGSSLGNLSMFEGLKIPRVHATQVIIASSSGSDGPLISDTLPSDYPSESHSEADDVDNRSIPLSSAGSFENKAYVQETYYSEYHSQEQGPEQPKFDVHLSVKSPQSECDLDRNLSTIMEQREESIRSMETSQFKYAPELHAPPRHVQESPTYSKVMRRDHQETHSVTEIIDNSHRILSPSLAPVTSHEYSVDMELNETFEPPISAVMHKPEITSHMVDDVFLRTITEKKTIEDIEKHKRLITEYHTRSKPIDQQWDVRIKNYPVEMPEPPEWENFSDISSCSGAPISHKPEKIINIPVRNTIKDNKLPLNSPDLVHNLNQPPTRFGYGKIDTSFLSTFNIPLDNPEVSNWHTLIRVLQHNEQDEDSPVIETADTFNSQLTLADRMKWRQIITTESTLRTLLNEAVTREDFERIRHDTRYERLFSSHKWDVIIRILTPIERSRGGRHRKKSDWDTRSRRSSLPTLYEYDSDGGSSIRTQEPAVQPSVPLRSRRTSRSSYRSDADVRSMSEMMVDFGRPMSEVSGYRYVDDGQTERSFLARTLSQPSLARSASEITERWIVPPRYDTTSEFTSPENSPRSHRRTTLAPDSTGCWTVSRDPNNSSTHFKYSSSASSKNWFNDNDSEASFK